jgi:hypothetical protein
MQIDKFALTSATDEPRFCGPPDFLRDVDTIFCTYSVRERRNTIGSILT